MAHELELRDGRASMFSVRLSPWHREGVVLPEHPSFNKAIELARLDYTVVKRSVVIDQTSGRVSERAFCTVRTDTNDELGHVGPIYEVVQNVDAMRVLEPLVDQGVLNLETGGVFRKGDRAWLLGSFDVTKFGAVVREVFANELIPYVLVNVSHDGSGQSRIMLTSIRVVCANTQRLADAESTDQNSVAVPHTAGATVKLIERATNLLGGIIERTEAVAKQYRAMKQTILTIEQFQRSVLDVCAPSPFDNPDFNPDARMASAVVERWEKRSTRLFELWDNGTGHTGDHSAWEAFQAVTEAVDHNVDGLFPTRAGTYRTASLLTGRLREVKDESFNRITALCQSAN